MSTILSAPAACTTCGFTSADLGLIAGHSCDVQDNGGHCEDYPACGHERGDCNGLLYGSDAAIQESARAHLHCDHENGSYECEGLEDEDEDGWED